MSRFECQINNCGSIHSYDNPLSYFLHLKEEHSRTYHENKEYIDSKITVLKAEDKAEGKYHGETIETIVENVFGTNVIGSTDSNYTSVYSVIDDDKRIEKHKKTGERNQMEWRYNPRLKN